MAFWVEYQQKNYYGKRGRVMNESRREMLENLPGWKWRATAGAHAASGASTARKVGEKVLEWQESQGCQRIPKRNSNDEHEKKLAKSLEDVLRRRRRAIGEKPCQQQLSADEIHFINGIPGVGVFH